MTRKNDVCFGINQGSCMSDMLHSEYYILARNNQRGMLLYSLPDPNDDDSWTMGQRFSKEPETPIVLEIITGYEQADPLPYFDSVPLISNELYALLLKSGVSNLDVYDAIIRSEDGAVEYNGYKAFNLIGFFHTADITARFDADNPSRLIDASIDSLSIDSSQTNGMLMFRLKEYSGAVLVHRSVKEAIEDAKIPFITFRNPEEFIS